MKKEAKVMFHKDRFEKMKNKDTFILLRNLYDSIYIMKFNYKIKCSPNTINNNIENVIKCYDKLKPNRGDNERR